MFGRSWACLLLFALSALGQSIEGQSDRVFPPDVAVPNVHIRIPQSLEGRATAASPFPRAPVPAPGSFGLPQFASAAGTIFAGTVTHVERHAASSAQPVEIVSISFHVEKAIRGASAGEEITISQWIGLWSAGQRYRVGERVLLFLYPRSKLGLTSCVGGQMGRFTIDSWGRVLFSAQHLSVFRTDPVLGGKSRVPFSDFALAVRRAGGEE
jgi:hypothetical protein